jgi:hypothetical protein
LKAFEVTGEVELSKNSLIRRSSIEVYNDTGNIIWFTKD